MSWLPAAAAACLVGAAAAEWPCSAAPQQAVVVSQDGGCFDNDELAEVEEALLAWQSLMQLQTPGQGLLPAPEPRAASGDEGARGQLAAERLRNATLRRNASQASPPRRRQEKLDSILELLRLQLAAAKHVAHQSFDPFPLEMRTPVGSSVFVAETLGEGPEYNAAIPPNEITQVSHTEDVWPRIRQSTAALHSGRGLAFFGSAPAEDWIVLAVVSILLFLLDLVVIQRFADSFRAHALTLVFWLLVAVAFNAWVWVRVGRQQAFNWCTGYFLEWILSMDNLLVFHLIFETYRTPHSQTRKAVFLGIIGAVVIRLVFFMVVSTLLQYFSWIRVPFGLLLVYSGVLAAVGDDDNVDVADTRLVKTLRWMLGDRLKDGYDQQGRLFVRSSSGHWQVTLLVMVVVLLELSDVVFALDSVSAKIAQIPQLYIAFSSTVIAMYGARAMFFIIKDLVSMFELLQYGLCLILVFMGTSLIASPWLKLPSGTVCVLIVSVFFIFTLASIVRKHARPAEDEPDKEDRKPWEVTGGGTDEGHGGKS